MKACPRGIIELRKKGPKGRRIYVSCVNRDKGPVAMKACKAACIGCGKCQKECQFDAITVANNVAYIDPAKCRLCRKCEKACPTHAIVSVNFGEISLMRGTMPSRNLLRRYLVDALVESSR